MYSTRQWKHKRRKLAAIGCRKVLKEESKDTSLGSVCESHIFQVNSSDSFSRSSTEEFQSSYLGATVEAKDLSRGQSTVLKKNLLKNSKCANGSSKKRTSVSYRDKSSKKRGGTLPSRSKLQSWCKSVSSLDLSNSMTCTPSYHLLPIKYMRQASSLHPLRAQVLNDHWVCIPSDRQNFNLKCIKRNFYEEKLQECEDKCCEVDVLLESTRAAIRRMEVLLNRIDSGEDVSLMNSHLTELERVSKMPVNLVKDASGLDILILREPEGASAVVYLYGGQVISWKNSRGDELLFQSSKATFKPPKAIRGGIPICFPQVSNLSSLEQHSVAKCQPWSIDPNPPPPPVNGIKTFADLCLKRSDDGLKTRPHNGYEVRLRVALGVANLTLTTRIRNIDNKPFSFTFALHTYFSVSDISEVRVEGLETLDYLDNLKNKERFTEQGDAITFDGELDRVYLKTPTKIAIIDHEKKRTLVLKKEGLPDAVVWNPWAKKSKTISDLGDEDYKRMVCVEAAAVEKPIVLKPGEEWKGRQEITAVASSYCSGQLDPLKVVNG